MKLLFAGGGTAGHVNPALAVAKKILAREPRSDIRFAGTPSGLEADLIPREGFHFYAMEMHGLSRAITPSGLAKNVKAAGEAVRAVRAMGKILKEFAPDAVFGTGGYASFPAVYAANRLGIPTALLEVNALPGVATRLLCKKARVVMLGFEAAKDRLPKGVRAVVTGSPVREELLFADRPKAKAELGFSGIPLAVSFWGSRGAAEMNRKMVEFIKLEDEERAFAHIHATGRPGFAWMPGALTEQGVDPAGNPLFKLTEYIYDMERVMAAADLVICRAGASTLAELAACGRASILAPSPHVAENHQEMNARVFERKGAAVVLTEKECTGRLLYEKTKELLFDPGKLADMERSARTLAVIDAADRICDEIQGIL